MAELTQAQLAEPHIGLEAVRFVGAGLNRPECVVSHCSGLLFAPDWTGSGGVSVISPSGAVARILATAPDAGIDMPLRANGVALEEGGSFLLAHLGAEKGGVYRLFADGRCEVVTAEADGAPLPPTNFVAADRRGRLWITVSTTKTPRALDYRPDAASGFIALYANGETRIVADQLGYTNECLLSADESVLYVNETFARRLTAFDIVGDRLENRRTVAEFGAGLFPDGLAEAEDGALFVTSIVSNAVVRIPQDGGCETVLLDGDREHLDWVEAAFVSGAMGRPHLDKAAGARLRNISNLAFGGPGLRTAFLGCLLGDQIAAFDCPVAGARPGHFDADLGPLAQYLEDEA
ncbi:MAG: SMP-30/gluconolactonase/LRE family protein [Neomegalonema sp.]|nr:SMP-30/gluconolactonase/LRE family protein [Neomegalonema sp.]